MAHLSERTIFIGVDGGGSSCRVRVADEGGQKLAERSAGPANVQLAFDEAIGTIRDCIAGALGAVPHPLPTCSLGLGLAGVSSPKIAAKVAAALADLGKVAVTHDGDIACIGAHGGEDGGLIVAGTGSAGVLREGGRLLAVGGRGFLLGDDGSGARLGLAALRQTLRAHDGFEEHTAFSRALMARYDDDPVAMIHWARDAKSHQFAAMTPMVFHYASLRDPMALGLVAVTAASLAEIGDRLRRYGARRLALVGGLARPIHPFLPDDLRQQLRPPLHDALNGALILAGAPGHILTPPEEP